MRLSGGKEVTSPVWWRRIKPPSVKQSSTLSRLVKSELCDARRHASLLCIIQRDILEALTGKRVGRLTCEFGPIYNAYVRFLATSSIKLHVEYAM